ncbi:tyrosine-type recombinase/integrase [Deinococcus fonticola]|uniref:tyrosine-type recombinase/integrase n=1 Tax=Deinococcus fonticola TaxID=2528713 RepID=UPI001074FD07|nr:site-specific integrase [Deinococcus fonticola]
MTEARRDAQEAREKARHGDMPRADNLTLDTLLESYRSYMAHDPQANEDEKDRRWSFRTTLHNASLHATYIKPHLGSQKAGAITPKMLRSYYQKLTAQKLGNSGQRQIASLLSGAYKWAIAEELLPPSQNPTRDAKPQRRKKVTAQVRSYDREQSIRLLEVCAKEPLGLPISFLLWTGLRIGELTALRRSDILVQEDGTIAIAVTKTRSEFRSTVYENETKTKESNRLVFLEAEAVEILNRRLELSKIEAASTGQPETDYLFAFLRQPQRKAGVAKQQLPLLHNTLRQAMQRICDMAQVPRLSPHKLRHTRASLLVAEGHSITAISKHLGHAKISTTTDFYVHSNHEEQKKLRVSLRKEEAGTDSTDDEYRCRTSVPP